MPHTTDKAHRVGLDPVTVDWARLNKNPKVNPKDIPIGSVVYFVRKKQNAYFVDYGLCIDHYKDCVAIQRVERRDRTLVSSEFTKKPVPIADFPNVTEWRKLPKDWWTRWRGHIFEYTSEPMTEEEAAFRIAPDEPQTIVEAYNRGYLVNVGDNPHSKIDCVIDKANGYRLEKRYEWEGFGKTADNYRFVHQDVVGIDFWQCFTTYQAAQEACDKYREALEAQAKLTDLEWSILLINKDIDRWAARHQASSANKASAKAYLMRLKDLENVETRVTHEGIQYKYWKNTRWLDVPIE